MRRPSPALREVLTSATASLGTNAQNQIPSRGSDSALVTVLPTLKGRLESVGAKSNVEGRANPLGRSTAITTRLIHRIPKFRHVDRIRQGSVGTVDLETEISTSLVFITDQHVDVHAHLFSDQLVDLP